MTVVDEIAAPVAVTRHAFAGASLGEVALDPAVFAVPVNVPLLHQVVTAQLAARRAGTQSTKTRAEVSGGGRKPYRQKGTGNARQGSIRAPHYAGGGIALGPKPRDYAQRTPRKMVQAALRCALSDRARSGQLRLVDSFAFETPRTKEAVAVLERLGAAGSVLVVLGRDDLAAAKSFANLNHVATVPADQLTAYDVLCADVVVFSDATLPGAAPEPVAPAPAKRAAKAARRPAPTETAEAPTETAEAPTEDNGAEEGEDR